MANNEGLYKTLAEYCERGWFLFPVSRGTKKPVFYGYAEEASNKIDQLKAWDKKYPNCNWGLMLGKSGLVCVDIDAKGLDAWGELTRTNGEPQTLKQFSGSGVGLHYIFEAKSKIRYRGKITDGVDVKHKGYILVAPSIHPKTNQAYKWARIMDPKPTPDWIAKYIEKPVGEDDVRGRKSPVYGIAGAQWYRKIIDELRYIEFGYDEWFKFGAALHSAFEGSAEGLELYLYLTGGVNFAEGDYEKARDKWASFKSDSTGLSAGSFIYMARELGIDIPAVDLKEDIELFRETGIVENNSVIVDKKTWFKNERGHLITFNPDFLVEDINSQGFVLLEGESAGLIAKYRRENGVEIFKTLSKENASTLLRTKSLRIRATHGYREVPAIDIWLESSGRASYRNVVFRPDADFEDLNLWGAIPCADKPGDVSLVLELIEVLCGHDKEKTRYLIQWLAHIFQKPAEKSVVVPVIIGVQGTGKGMLTDGLLYRMLSGHYYIRLDKAATLKEKFNAEQSRKFLTVLDEASWRGDHELAAIMKSLTGSAKMTIEEKFGGRYTIDNFSRYMITTNDTDAVRIETSNRRYLVLEAAKTWIGTDKFERLAKQLKNGVHEAFYSYLKKVDLSDFKPFVFPEHLDTFGDQTKINSMPYAGEFLVDMFFEEPKKIFRRLKHKDQNEIVYFDKRLAFQQFQLFCESVKARGARPGFRGFMHVINKLIPGLIRYEKRAIVGGEMKGLVALTPKQFCTEFCRANRLNMPEFFDDKHFIDEDFKD